MCRARPFWLSSQKVQSGKSTREPRPTSQGSGGYALFPGITRSIISEPEALALGSVFRERPPQFALAVYDEGAARRNRLTFCRRAWRATAPPIATRAPYEHVIPVAPRRGGVSPPEAARGTRALPVISHPMRRGSTAPEPRARLDALRHVARHGDGPSACRRRDQSEGHLDVELASALVLAAGQGPTALSFSAAFFIAASKPRQCAGRRCSGMIISREWPSASSAGKPNSAAAAPLQRRIVPERSAKMTASEPDRESIRRGSNCRPFCGFPQPARFGG